MSIVFFTLDISRIVVVCCAFWLLSTAAYHCNERLCSFFKACLWEMFQSLQSSTQQIESHDAHILLDLWGRGVMQLCGIAAWAASADPCRVPPTARRNPCWNPNPVHHSPWITTEAEGWRWIRSVCQTRFWWSWLGWRWHLDVLLGGADGVVQHAACVRSCGVRVSCLACLVLFHVTGVSKSGLPSWLWDLG